MTTLTQSGGSPLLVVPLLLTPPPPRGEEQPRQPPPAASKLAAVYIGIGVLIGVDNLMYAYALLYLPVSTFSLVAATQLAFNAVTSRLINAQRFTPLITNSVAVLTFSATLLAVSSSSDTSGGDHLPRGKYAAGFVLTLAASATFALILSLYEVTFEKVIKAQTPRWVLRVQMYSSLVASAVAVAGMMTSGEWRTIAGEAAGFRGGKVVAMLMAVWGVLSYVYQHYLDDRRVVAERRKDGEECGVCAARMAAGDVVSLAGHSLR
ncbi:hypothetical protein HU200_056127 [Digitaria exilis]|uniref:Purine permease 11 n=1 Tax=Digitaria exilis TaxID=1010633 RepID=A0A835AHQ8_9POAL|nr:hypothetical protein HU200_056127 [Digitaria exilis]